MNVLPRSTGRGPSRLSTSVTAGIVAAILNAVVIPCGGAARGEEGGRYALLVGVEKYNPAFLVPLEYAEDDMLAVGGALSRLGFNVVTMTSAAEIPERRPVTAADILGQIDRRLRGRVPADTVVLGFSGHGVQLKGDAAGPDDARETWFCPERARTDDATTLLPMSQVLERLKACPARQKLLLVDACRVEVEPKSIRDKSGVPIRELDAAAPFRKKIPESTAALFSCGPRQKSFELADLGHSVFTHFVVEYLEDRANAGRRPSVLELATYVTRQTRDLVDQRLNDDQQPELVLPAGRFTDWSLGTLGDLASVERKPAMERPAANGPLPAVPPVPPASKPARPAVGAIVENSLGMKLVMIPDGRFSMGSNERDDEKPVHTVRITKPFLMGQTEVTQAQWKRVMETAPWRGRKYVVEDGDAAASYVSWEDAVEFCRKLTGAERAGSQAVGRGAYRLPTEAEWEYTCRAGTKTRFSFGDDERELSTHAWWGGIFGAGNGNTKAEQYAHRVGSLLPNDWHLHDMHGNVLEWCSDWYAPGYGSASEVVDPRGPPSATARRVLRGGCWDSSPVFCRSACRGDKPADRGDVGFRVVCEVE